MTACQILSAILVPACAGLWIECKRMQTMLTTAHEAHLEDLRRAARRDAERRQLVENGG